MSQTRKQPAIFPDLPRDPKFVDKNGNVTPQWQLYLQQLTLALQTNYKAEGIVIPPQSAANITQLTGTQSFNNIVYDSTNGAFNGNVNGSWKTFVLI